MKIERWVSKGIRISQSAAHESTFIVEFADGTFYSIASSLSAMKKVHPPDNSRFDRDYKQFLRTSNYSPQSAGFVSSLKQSRGYAKQSRN